MNSFCQLLEWFDKALNIREKVLGKEHPNTAMTYNNIAIVHGTQGDFNTALVWYGKALRVDNKVWGPGHMHFNSTRDNAEFAYARSGREAPFADWLAETLAGD